MWGNSDVIFLGQMISNEKVVDYKGAQLFKIYNFCFGIFSIWGHLKSSNFEFEKLNIIFVE